MNMNHDNGVVNAMISIKELIENFICPSESSVQKIIGHRIEATGQQDGDSNNGEAQSISRVEAQMFARLKKEEILRQENLNAITGYALEDIPEDSQVNGKDVDIGWILKFIDLAGDISDEILQKVWGKILSAKVQNADGVSLHSLVVIANLSPEVAKCFNIISKYIFNVDGVNVLIHDNKFNAKYGMIYSDIMMLDEYGLINSSGTLSMKNTLTNSSKWAIKYGKKISLGYAVTSTDVQIPVFVLREAGNDLMSIMDICYDENYFDKVKKYITKENGNKVFFIDIVDEN